VLGTKHKKVKESGEESQMGRAWGGKSLGGNMVLMIVISTQQTGADGPRRFRTPG